MSSEGSGSSTVEFLIAFSVQSRASWSGILVNNDFTSKDTSLWSSGICIVLMATIKFSVDCSLCLDSSVRGFSTLVKYLDSWWVGDPQKETMGPIGMLGLCSFGSPYSLGGCGVWYSVLSAVRCLVEKSTASHIVFVEYQYHCVMQHHAPGHQKYCGQWSWNVGPQETQECCCLYFADVRWSDS